MYILDEIRAKRDEISAIARRHKAEKLWVFGSCARKEERPDSDVDFLVKLSEDASGFASVRIRRELESLLNNLRCKAAVAGIWYNNVRSR